jgi:hypothetical protein
MASDKVAGRQRYSAELPRIIRDEFDAFLECGILAHEFLRLRCGLAADFNIHLHCPVLDGVYRCGASCAPVFVQVGVPTDDEVHALLQNLIARLVRIWMHTRRGVLVNGMSQTCLAEPDADGKEARTLQAPQATAITYRIAFGPAPGRRY